MYIHQLGMGAQGGEESGLHSVFVYRQLMGHLVLFLHETEPF